MTTHMNEELPALVSGELDGEATRAIAHHLRICGECRAELVEVALAHGSLTAAMRAEQELALQLRTGLPQPAESSSRVASPGVAQPPLRLPRRHQHAGRLLVAACLVLVAGATALGVSLSQHSSPRPIAAVASLAPARGSGRCSRRGRREGRRKDVGDVDQHQRTSSASVG